MSKRVKLIVSVVVAMLLLTVGIAVPVMAQEEPRPTPEAGTNGLLARVAEILDISEENLLNAFKQARQEMKEEAFLRGLDKAVAKGFIAQEEADEIEEWWEQKPEVLDRSRLRHAFGFPTLRNHIFGAHRGWQRAKPPMPAD